VGIAVSADYTPVTRESGSGPNSKGALTLTADTLTITNGQVITLGEYPVIIVSNSGQASEVTTNTIAAASATQVGRLYTILQAGVTNGVLIVDSAPVYNSGVTLSLNDSSTYFVKATNQIVQVSTINN
jgi:hypothetical protein